MTVGERKASGGGVPRWLWGALAILLVGWLAYALRAVLTPVAFAFMIAYLCDPIVDRLEQWRVPRGLATAIVLTGVLLVLALLVLLWLPAVVGEVIDFAQRLPALAEHGFEQLRRWAEGQGIELPERLGDALQQLDLNPGVAKEALAPAAAVLRWLVGGTASVADTVMALVMVPVFAAYLLYDFDRIVAALYDLVPRARREAVAELAREVDRALALFVRGQLSVMMALAVLYSVAYGLVGVPLAVPIGIVAGVLSFVPYVGAAIGLGLAVLMTLLHWSGWGQLLALLVAYGVVQTLEGFVLTPRLVGSKTGLSDVWVLFALMAGGELFGFLGVLLALPAAAVVRVFVLRGLRIYRRSRFYLGASAEGGDEAAPGGAAAAPDAEGDELLQAPPSVGDDEADDGEGQGGGAEKGPGAPPPGAQGEGDVKPAAAEAQAEAKASAASESVTKE